MPDELSVDRKPFEDTSRGGGRGRGTRSYLATVVVFAAIAVLCVVASDAWRRSAATKPVFQEGDGARDPAAGLATPSGSPRVEARRTAASEDPDPVPLERGMPSVTKRSAPTFLLEGRAVDAHGNPIEGAQVFVGQDQSCSALPVATSGSDGAFGAEVVKGPRLTSFRVIGSTPFFVGSEGWTTVPVVTEVHAETTVRLGEIVLAPGATITGHVLDEDGQPVERASVGYRLAAELPADLEEARRVGFPSFVESDRCPDALTDASGAFCLRGVAAEDVFLVAWAAGQLFSETEILSLRPGDRVERTLRLLPDESARWDISGRVLLPDGRLLPDAWLRWGPMSTAGRRHGPSNVDGEFRIRVRDRGPHWIEASDPDERWYSTRVDGVAPGTRDLEIVLGEPRWLTVALQDRGGDSVPWGHVRGRGEEGFQLTSAGSTGEARVLRPRRPFSVEAFAPGFRTEEFGPYDPTELGDHLVLSLSPGEALAGRVVSRGSPVVGARIELGWCCPPGTIGWSASPTTQEDSFTSLAGSGMAERHDATTDGDGRFVVTLHRDGWHRIRIEAEGFPTHFAGPFEFSRETGYRGLEIELAEGGAIEGRVLEAAGAMRRRVVGVSNGWGVAHTALVDEEGAYRIENLQPGLYQVRPCVEPVGSRVALVSRGQEEGTFEADCSVLPGETTHFDLDLRSEGSFVLRGRLDIERTGEGSSPRDAVLYALDPQGRRSRSLVHGEIDSSGDFQMALSQAGTFLLEIRVSAARLHALVDLVVGTTEWSASIETGTLRFRSGERGGSDDGALSVFWDAGDVSYHVPVWLASSDGDDAVLSDVPAGRVRILRIPEDVNPITRRRWHDPRGWPLVREVEVRAGEETIVELPR